jgi:hypothetical protein
MGIDLAAFGVATLTGPSDRPSCTAVLAGLCADELVGRRRRRHPDRQMRAVPVTCTVAATSTAVYLWNRP